MENTTNDSLLFQLLDQFMKISQPGFDNWEKTYHQWSQFKTLISNCPIDYLQVFNFISKMQEIDIGGSISAADPEQPVIEIPTQNLQNGSSSRSNNFLKGNQQSQSISQFQPAQNTNSNERNSQRGYENGSRNSDLFASNNSYMFKTAAAGTSYNSNNQSNKKEDLIQSQQRSSTRDPFKNLNGDIPERNSQLTSNNYTRQSFNGGSLTQLTNGLTSNDNHLGGLGIKGVNSSARQKVNGINIDKDSTSPSNETAQLNFNNQGQSQSTFSGGIQGSSNQKEQHTNYQKSSEQGNGHHNKDMRSDPTGNEDHNMFYTMKSFDQFLKQHTRIHLGSNKATFANTSVLQLNSDQNTLLKFVGISLFVNILSELPHPESPTENSCTSSKTFLTQLFLKVYNKKLTIISSPLQLPNSVDAMYNSFTKNIGQLLQLYCLHGQSPVKLVRTFLHQIQQDATFLESLSALMKNLVGEFVEESDYETIAWFLNQQQQQQQQQNVSMASTCASISQFNNNNEKERRQKLGSKLRTSEWTSVKAEWLFLLSLALQRPIELFNLRDNKLEQTLFKSKKMVVSPVVFKNKINILTITPQVTTNQITHQSLQTYYLLTMTEYELDVFTQNMQKKNGKILDLRLNEEVNFIYLLKHLTYQPVSQSPASNPTQPIIQIQQAPQINQTNEQPIREREYSMGHRSSKLGSHLNSVQDSNKPLQHHVHNSSVDDQLDLKSQSGKNLHQLGVQPQIGNNLTNIPNSSNLTPRIQAFVQSPQGIQSQPHQQQQKYQEQPLQKSIPSYSPDPKLSLGGVFGRFQHGTINNNTTKSATTYLNHQSNLVSVNPADDWNRSALFGKVKDLMFKLNINTEQLNHLAKFPLSSSAAVNNTSNSNSAGIQSKENIHPKSPLKYKSVLYPINKQPTSSSNQNSTSTLASFLFSQYLPQSSPAPASSNLGYSSPFGISFNNPTINNNNTSYSSGMNINNNIPGNNYGINHLTSEPRLQQHHNNSTMNNNNHHQGSLSPTPSLGQNNQLTSSTHISNNNSTFTSSFSKAANNNKNTPHSFLGVGNFAFSSLGSMNIGGNGPASLSSAGSFKRHPNTTNYNIGTQDLQYQRDILNKVSPRRNLNTQY